MHSKHHTDELGKHSYLRDIQYCVYNRNCGCGNALGETPGGTVAFRSLDKDKPETGLGTRIAIRVKTKRRNRE